MIYKSEFPVLCFTSICKGTDVNFRTVYDWQIYGFKRNEWPDITETDPAISTDRYDNFTLYDSIDCVNAYSVFKCNKYFQFIDGADHVFIRLSPGKWYAMQKSTFKALFRYTGNTMDELPVFISYAEPMSSDDKYTVMRPIYDTSNSVTLETEYARILYPGYTDKNNVCRRSACWSVPDWMQKYTFSLYDDLENIDLGTEAMFIKGKFGIFNRNDILAFIGMKGRKPIIYVCKSIGSDSLDNEDRVIKEPCVVLSPEEYINLDKKQIPTIIDVVEDDDKGFFNDAEVPNNEHRHCMNIYE